MTTRDAYARLLELDVPVLRTADVASALRMSTTAATMLLRRLGTSGLARQLRKGTWVVGQHRLDRYAIIEALTAPMPSYVSLHTALYLHGMIEQVPAVVYVVSLGRTQRIKTTLAVYSVHRIAPELFDGFDTRQDGTKVATAEKAIFDMAYYGTARSRLFARVPELELPGGFRERKVRTWSERIHDVRRKSIVQKRIDSMLEHAARA